MSLGSFPPVVAFGRTLEKTGLTVGNGTNIILFDNSGVDYTTADDSVFVCDGAGSDSEFQFLGEVTSSDVSGITTKLSTNSNKGSSAKIWKPTTGFRFNQPIASPALAIYDTGVEHQISPGGDLYTISVSDPTQQVEWRWPSITQDNWKRWRDFIINDRDNNHKHFTAAYWDYEDINPANIEGSIGASVCVEAASLDRILPFRAPKLNIARVGLRLFVVNPDAYVDA